MERNFFGLLGFVFVLLILPFSLTAQESSRQQLIQDRLLSEISNINDQLSRLNRTVNRLENQVSQLRNENQNQRNRINELEQTVSGSEDRSESSASRWEPRPNVPYQIRREPLEEELIYTTTDDTTLTKLAHIYYRDASFWRRIYQVNKDRLPSPDVVPPKVQLRLPPIDELKSKE